MPLNLFSICMTININSTRCSDLIYLRIKQGRRKHFSVGQARQRRAKRAVKFFTPLIIFMTITSSTLVRAHLRIALAPVIGRYCGAWVYTCMRKRSNVADSMINNNYPAKKVVRPKLDQPEYAYVPLLEEYYVERILATVVSQASAHFWVSTHVPNFKGPL